MLRFVSSMAAFLLSILLSLQIPSAIRQRSNKYYFCDFTLKRIMSVSLEGSLFLGKNHIQLGIASRRAALAFILIFSWLGSTIGNQLIPLLFQIFFRKIRLFCIRTLGKE